MADRDDEGRDEQGTPESSGERTAAPYEFSGRESSGDDDAPREGGQRREAAEYDFSGGESSGEQEKDQEETGPPETAATKTPDGTFKGRHRIEKEQERERLKREREANEGDDEKSRRKKRRLAILGAIVGAIALLIIVLIVVSSNDDKQGGKVEGPAIGNTAINKRFDGIPQDGLTLGSPKAPVTLVEFADLQCPFCKQASDNVLPTLVDRYVKAGKLRIEFRNFAILGPDSEKAARALAGAADQGKAWQFLDLWYLNQGEENTGYVTDEFIRKIAGGVRGLDAQRVVTASNDASNTESLQTARTEANKFGVDATPSFLLGKTGQPLTQLQLQDPSDPNLFTQAIDRQLGAAQE